MEERENALLFEDPEPEEAKKRPRARTDSIEERKRSRAGSASHGSRPGGLHAVSLDARTFSGSTLDSADIDGGLQRLISIRRICGVLLQAT